MQNLSYRYDSVGNITQIANSIAGETSVYDYDALDRLTNWQLNQDSPETYTYNAQGNLDVKNGLNLNYNDANHKHAVTHIGATQKYWYDDNGNQVTRIVGADTFDLAYDAENRLVEVKKNDVTISQFTYDGDGQRVKSVIDGETTRFVGGHYERKGSQITKYYMAGATRVAMRKYTIPQRMTVEYMLGDHLGSTSITTDSNGAMISEIRYKSWGETRYTWTNAPANTSPAYELVKYQFTGQYSYDIEFGLKYYGARFYDSAVGRFVSADTVIPGGTQGYDRYAYSYNNSLRYVDPSGHNPILALLLLLALTGCATNAPTPSAPPTQITKGDIQSLIDIKDKATYQAAIDLTIKYYGLNVGDSDVFVNDNYDSLMGSAKTYKSGDIGVSYTFFPQTPGELGTTIGHELIHVKQIDEGRFYTGDDNCSESQQCALNEIEAYRWELSQAVFFALTDDEIANIEYWINYYYNVLTDANRQNADNDNYTESDDE